MRTQKRPGKLPATVSCSSVILPIRRLSFRARYGQEAETADRTHRYHDRLHELAERQARRARRAGEQATAVRIMAATLIIAGLVMMKVSSSSLALPCVPRIWAQLRA